MTRYWKAALGAAVLTCAGQAHGATVISYTIETQGGGTRTTNSGSVVTDTPIYNYSFTINVPVDGNPAYPVATGPDYRQISYASTYFSGPGYTGGGGGATANGASLSFAQSQGFYAISGLVLSVNACLAANSGGVFQAGMLSIVQDCGGVSYVDAGAGLATSYTGVVRRITGRITDGSVGLISVTAGVPEPSTWTLMLAGFGLAGCALRRRVKYSPAL